MLSRLKIGPKLLLAPFAALVLLSCGAYYAMARQNQSLDNVSQRAVAMRSVDELVAQAQKAHTAIYQLHTWSGGGSARSRIDALMQEIRRQHAEIERGFAALATLIEPSGAERGYVEQAAGAYRDYVRTLCEAMEPAHPDQPAAAKAMSKAEAAFDVAARRLAELSRREQELSERAAANAADVSRTIAILMPLVIALTAAASLAITMAVRRVLLAEIRGIGAAAACLTKGDLTVRERVHGSDEIAETARALDAGIRNLNGTLRTILDLARSIGSSSREISLGNLSLTSREMFRAGSFARTVSSMQELAATANRAVDSAQAANLLAESASSVAQQGDGTVERLASTMESVKGSARQVVEIVGQIEAIANEGRMLALNAAIEAARSRAQGRSFAVAATEMCDLAQRAGAAAREIRALAAQSVADIEGSTEWAAEAGSSMAHIASSVRQVGDIVSQIGCVNAKQASGLSEVNRAIVQMDQVTRQNSALVAEAAAAARSLQMQALTLSCAVAAFRLDEAQAPPAAPASEAGNVAALCPPGQPRGRRLQHPHLRLVSSRK